VKDGETLKEIYRAYDELIAPIFDSMPHEVRRAAVDTLEARRRQIVGSGPLKDEVPREPALRIQITLKPERRTRPATLQLMSRLGSLREISFDRAWCTPEPGVLVNVWRDAPDVTEPLLSALDADEAVETYQKIEGGS
jgi:hypothetical protein